MSKEVYPKAPITEALIDIRIDPPLNSSINEILDLQQKLGNKYTSKKERRNWETRFGVKDGVPIASIPQDKGIDGYQFWSEDKKDICQFRLDGFTFSRLEPYQKWDVHFPEAMKCWKLYKDNLNPINIKRIAVRYINLIKIPGPKIELSDYIVDAPKPPHGIPQDINNFLTRFMVKYNEFTHAIITLTTKTATKVDEIPIILDIDVSSNIKQLSGYEGLTKDLETLHSSAEDIFENTLTEKSKDLFR